MHVHERRENVPSGYMKDGAAPSDHVLNLRLALVQSNFKSLEDKFYAVSTPGNAEYGQHLSKEQVEALVAPSSDTASAVKDWLSSHGISSNTISPAGEWVGINVTVQQVNTLLDADYSTFTHQSTGQQTVRTLSYSIPADLKSHLSLVHPTVAFPVKPFGSPKVVGKFSKKSNLTADAAPASCGTAFTLTCAQQLYGIPSAPATRSSNRIAVAGFIDQWANLADLKSFLQTYRTDISPSTTFSTVLIDGGENDQSTPGIEALGARGTSIFFSSGDGGVSGGQSQSCSTFVPTFPSTCPFVTSVGGTTNVPETAASLSSGGFSTLFAIPDYQSADVSTYLSKLGNTNAGLFNKTGRAFPDLAAFATNVEIVLGGQFGADHGESVRAAQRQAHRSWQGAAWLLEPLDLRQQGRVHRRTSGDNPGCGTNGFSAGTGWDPVTGVGSPIYSKLRTVAGL
ncbi:hypothetical protein EWM64_g4597 [Hericium alpestre]|uniref:Peptidase S53 domain-containing protein n=1 Tax=Hericium alpestre TaxID=135208 RepID=A0A4Y9ZXW3_9AGAM|nr:hypothetical protein EWM64_g4597 [Hericium alpestre]